MNPIRNNQTKPTQTQTTPIARAGGVNRSRVQASPASENDQGPAWSERRREVFDYVARVLPDEHLGFGVSAALAIRLSGEKPTAEAIRLRLQGSGRSMEQLRAKGWTP